MRGKPVVLTVVRGPEPAHQGLILDRVGADRTLGGLFNRGLMWVQ
jgi:hypothetical protein